MNLIKTTKSETTHTVELTQSEAHFIYSCLTILTVKGIVSQLGGENIDDIRDQFEELVDLGEENE
jgi:hypothetical protein